MDARPPNVSDRSLKPPLEEENRRWFDVHRRHIVSPHPFFRTSNPIACKTH
jgi:hypothetical protein